MRRLFSCRPFIRVTIWVVRMRKIGRYRRRRRLWIVIVWPPVVACGRRATTISPVVRLAEHYIMKPGAYLILVHPDQHHSGRPHCASRSLRPDANTRRRGSVFPPRINPPPRVLPRIPKDARPVDEPQRVGFDVPPRRRIVVPHPVLVQARFELEPLAGEAQVDRRAGQHMDVASP